MNPEASLSEDQARNQAMAENNFAAYTFASVENISCVGVEVLQKMDTLLTLFTSMKDPQTKARAATYFT